MNKNITKITFTGQNAVDVQDVLMMIDESINVKFSNDALTIIKKDDLEGHVQQVLRLEENETIVYDNGNLYKETANKSKQYTDTSESIDEFLNVFGLNKKDVQNTVDELTNTIKDSISPKARTKRRVVKETNKFKDRVSTESKRFFKNVKYQAGSVQSAVENKINERKEQEQVLFDRLRNDSSYNGLSDDELKNLIKSRRMMGEYK
mgnify:FL=1